MFDPGPTARPTCRHCRAGVVCRPRGLCWPCYHAHRDAYPSTSKFANCGVGRTPPRRRPVPTPALPGTADKVNVLAERAAAGEVLFHPKDATR